MKIWLSIIMVIGTVRVFSQNPIVPPGTYVADPSARNWDGSTLYLYGTRDESPQYYCSWSYPVLYTSDMSHWQIKENVFSSKGENDQVPYSDSYLYAPDCQLHNSRYYLYYCLATNQDTEGVAVSDAPTGPFTNSQVINTFGHEQIDPAVFIDDDGQAYYLWGQFNLKMARLNPDMQTLDSLSLVTDVITEEAHYFHEGAYLTKHNDLYYLVYADISRANRPTCLGYATSNSPMGPYVYRGVIIDNDHSDPGVWNNHGSIAEFKGKWYVFYHRSTHGSNTMRKACVEPFDFNPDGSIDEVEMTTQGAAGPLPAKDTLDAARACLLFGHVRIVADAPDVEVLQHMQNTDKAGYKYLDFASGVDSVEFRVAPGSSPVTIDVSLEQSFSPSVSKIHVAGSDTLDNWQTLRAAVKKVKGTHAVWLRFYGDNPAGLKVDWFRFF